MQIGTRSPRPVDMQGQIADRHLGDIDRLDLQTGLVQRGRERIDGGRLRDHDVQQRRGTRALTLRQREDIGGVITWNQ